MENYQYYGRKDETNLPPGFRFHPTDEELITYYLLKKVLDSSFTCLPIAEVDLNKSEPWHLPGKAKIGEKEWYFYSLRDRKYPTGLRTNRATEAGYWKATGKDREIYTLVGKSNYAVLVGLKKTLVFYGGRAPKGEKTNWVMHEYRLEGHLHYHYFSSNSKDEWVISRVFQKSNGGCKGGGGGSSSCSSAKKRPSSDVVVGSSPSSVSQFPPLLDSSTISNTVKDEHVPCFSMVPPPPPPPTLGGGYNPFFEIPPPPQLLINHEGSSSLSSVAAASSHYPIMQHNVAFPCLRSTLQENSYNMPHLFSGGDVQLLSGNYADQKMGMMNELSCIWDY